MGQPEPATVTLLHTLSLSPEVHVHLSTHTYPHTHQKKTKKTAAAETMARRAAPPHSGPAYYTPAQLSRGPLVDPNESAWSRFLRTQIFAPDKLPGNVNIVAGVGLFVGGVFVVRRWGELFVPV
jgi:hypothetical protein